MRSPSMKMASASAVNTCFPMVNILLGAAGSGMAVLPICRVPLPRATVVPEIVSKASPGEKLPPPTAMEKPIGSALKGGSAIV